MPFKSNGTLPPGFHDWTIEEVKEKLVEKFDSSKTRGKIFDGYRKLIADIKNYDIVIEQWLNGSFSTSKIDPNDLDLLTLVDVKETEKIKAPDTLEFQSLFKGKETAKEYDCDSYLLVKLDENHPEYPIYHKMHKYWYGEFGLDRTYSPKGIVRVQL